MSDIAHRSPVSSPAAPSPRPHRYSGTAAARPWAHAALAAFCALALGGCSISYKLESMFGEKDDPKPVTTGTVQPAKADGGSAVQDAAAGAAAQERDLAYAKAAVSELFARGGSDSSLPWENPQTGARGTVTPVAAAYSHEGFMCRDFRASYLRDGSEAWLQGEACRVHHGKWDVKSMRPLQPS
jgi:surface antigen